MEKYLPLQIIEKLDSYEKLTSQINVILQAIGIEEDVSGNDFLDFTLSSDFANPFYSDDSWKGKFNSAILYGRKLPNIIKKNLIRDGLPFDEVLSLGPISLALCAGACFSISLAVRNWATDKQAYKPDPIFADALLKTADACTISFARNEAEHLPCRAFYLDLSGCSTFESIAGVFVFVGTSENGMAVLLGLVPMDEIEIYPHLLNREYKDDVATFIYDYKNVIYNTKDLLTDSILKAVAFSLQMIAYLSSKEPDIEEDPMTKKSYKKPTVIHNKFSEVQEWDVGVRYASEVKKSLNSGSTRHPASGRKSPIPHFRRAHWSHYWVGKGRKERVTRWIKPVMVGAGNSAKDVVIHRTASS